MTIKNESNHPLEIIIPIVVSADIRFWLKPGEEMTPLLISGYADVLNTRLQDGPIDLGERDADTGAKSFDICVDYLGIKPHADAAFYSDATGASGKMPLPEMEDTEYGVTVSEELANLALRVAKEQLSTMADFDNSNGGEDIDLHNALATVNTALDSMAGKTVVTKDIEAGKRPIRDIRIGDHVDLECDIVADPEGYLAAENGEDHGAASLHPEFAFEFAKVASITYHHHDVEPAIVIEFESTFTCGFPLDHVFDVDPEQERD